MLKKLVILNGKLSTNFDSLNTIYTVDTDQEVEKLEIEYVIEESDQISIFNNQINNNQSEIVITVYNDEESMSYYLEVYPTKTILKEDNEKYLESLELNQNKAIPKYVTGLIIGTCFIMIFLLFIILFKKKKNY